MNLTVGRRILLGFSVVLVLLLIATSFSVIGINGIVDNASEVIDGNKLTGTIVQREVDHLNWAAALGNVLTDSHIHEFKGQTDPTKCGFGKWFYGEGRKHAEKLVPALKPLFKKVESHHSSLHHSAVEIMKHYKATDDTLPAFLAQKETDHYAWAITLMKNIVGGAKSAGVQTDHTKCGFGKFIYGDKMKNVARMNPEIGRLVDSIKAPHQDLHTMAIKIDRHLKNGEQEMALHYYSSAVMPKLEQIKAIFADLKAVAHRDVAGLAKARDIFATTTSSALTQVKSILHDITTTTRKYVKTDDVMLAAANQTRVITLIMGLISIIAGIILAFMITGSIVKPLIRISDSVGSSANEMASASGQLSNASQNLAASSNEQASSIEETSASLEELSGIVSNNVGNAEQSATISNEVKQVSVRGGEAIVKLIESMKEILKSNEKIQQLVTVIGEIGEKTAIIDEIVFQTKLLSFNASVEAERAGEHGRGFAVVAQEVGNLAQMSGKAALEISSIVKESISSAKTITAENKSKVEDGNKLVQSTAEILQEIEDKSKEVASNISNILKASKEQAIGIEQINEAMVQLDKATQSNASTSEETASSSEELSSQANSLTNVVGELVSLVTGKSA